MNLNVTERAAEIADFLQVPLAVAEERLRKGFRHNHHLVADDFRRANPTTDAALLDWYRQTDSYIWELTAYHLDPGFNYVGMVRGFREALENLGWADPRVLVLGDGIGDLTMGIAHLGAVYNDLAGSRTAEFARFRWQRKFGSDMPCALSGDFAPFVLGADTEPFNAILAFDFFEHVPNVEEWVHASWDALLPGGLFLCQNAFGIGSPDHGGSIPMHLSVNDRFEKDWDPLLDRVGFVRMPNGWRAKP